VEWGVRKSGALHKHPELLRIFQRPQPRNIESIATWFDEQLEAINRLRELCGVDEMLKPFAVREFIDPAQVHSLGDLDSAFKRPDWGGVLDLKEGDANEHYRRGVVIVAFDLNFDLGQQLRDTKQMLGVERRALGIERPNQRMHPNRWPTYLRILDAKARGASLSAIARSLALADDKSAVDIKSRVHEMVDAARGVQIKLTS